MAQGLPPGTPPPSPQGAAPGGAPQGGPPAGGGGGGQPGPMQFLHMIQQGFQGLGPMIQQAGKQLPPEDIQLFSQAQKLSEALIQSLTQGSPGPAQAPQKAPGQAPTPVNAAPKGSAPSNYGGG